MAKEKLNKGHYDQATDRAKCIIYLYREFLLKFPAIEQDAMLTTAIIRTEEHFRFVQEKTYELGTGAIVLDDRAAWLCEAVSDLLVNELESDKKAYKMAHSAMSKLWDLFQHLANKHFEATKQPAKPKKSVKRKQS